MLSPRALYPNRRHPVVESSRQRFIMSRLLRTPDPPSGSTFGAARLGLRLLLPVSPRVGLSIKPSENGIQ